MKNVQSECILSYISTLIAVPLKVLKRHHCKSYVLLLSLECVDYLMYLYFH